MNEEIRTLIAEADRAIREERFDDLMGFYTDDAVLVISPGQLAQGKAAIRAAFVRIAAYFQHSIVPAQGSMVMGGRRYRAGAVTDAAGCGQQGGFCLQHGAACDLCLPPDRSEMAVRHRQFVRHFIAG